MYVYGSYLVMALAAASFIASMQLVNNRVRLSLSVNKVLGVSNRVC